MFVFSYGLSEPSGESNGVFDMPEAQFDWGYLSDHNVEEIRINIKNRKHVGNIDRVVSIVSFYIGVFMYHATRPTKTDNKHEYNREMAKNSL